MAILVENWARNSFLYPLQASDGPIDAIKTVAEVRQEPYGLPAR